MAEALLGIAAALARHVRQRACVCSAGSACDLPEEGILLLLFDRTKAQLLWFLDPEGPRVFKVVGTPPSFFVCGFHDHISKWIGAEW